MTKAKELTRSITALILCCGYASYMARILIFAHIVKCAAFLTHQTSVCALVWPDSGFVYHARGARASKTLRLLSKRVVFASLASWGCDRPRAPFFRTQPSFFRELKHFLLLSNVFYAQELTLNVLQVSPYLSRGTTHMSVSTPVHASGAGRVAPWRER